MTIIGPLTRQITERTRKPLELTKWLDHGENSVSNTMRIPSSALG